MHLFYFILVIVYLIVSSVLQISCILYKAVFSSFSTYVSEYQFGMCREWLWQASSYVTKQELPETKSFQCPSCSVHTNCSSCLGSLSCGWCYDASNPVTGKLYTSEIYRVQHSFIDYFSLKMKTIIYSSRVYYYFKGRVWRVISTIPGLIVQPFWALRMPIGLTPTVPMWMSVV